MTDFSYPHHRPAVASVPSTSSERRKAYAVSIFRWCAAHPGSTEADLRRMIDRVEQIVATSYSFSDEEDAA